jgi:8-oxo-dGTP pyrophosphatase MutT (NUDIX family)
MLAAHGRLGQARAVERFLRHIAACNAARLPGERLALRIGGAVVGWLRPAVGAALAEFSAIRAEMGGLSLQDAATLPSMLRALATDGHLRWRGEAFDVRAVPDGPVLAQADRGALPVLGIMSVGVHVSGLVRTADGLKLWVATRSADRHLDPGRLDHLVAGGVPAGLTPAETVLKEAAEEAGVPAELALAAVPVGRIAYATERAEGLRRDLLWCYDLELPEGFVPRPTDGEVERFELWPIARALDAVRSGESFKFNVALVLIDLFLRLGLIDGPPAARLRAALQTPVPGAPGVPLGANATAGGG